MASTTENMNPPAPPDPQWVTIMTFGKNWKSKFQWFSLAYALEMVCLFQKGMKHFLKPFRPIFIALSWRALFSGKILNLKIHKKSKFCLKLVLGEKLSNLTIFGQFFFYLFPICYEIWERHMFGTNMIRQVPHNGKKLSTL